MKGNESAIKWNYWDKIKAFFKRDILAIIGSIIVLVFWYQEKVKIEEHRFKLSEYFRLENSVNQMLFGHRILQVQTDQTVEYKAS